MRDEEGRERARIAEVSPSFFFVSSAPDRRVNQLENEVKQLNATQ